MSMTSSVWPINGWLILKTCRVAMRRAFRCHRFGDKFLVYVRVLINETRGKW
jgi:hypothetical protein